MAKGKEYWRTLFTDAIYYKQIETREEAKQWCKNTLPKYMQKDAEIKRILEDAFPKPWSEAEIKRALDKPFVMDWTCRRP